MRTSLVLAAAGLLLITAPALAAVRDERPARDSAPASTPVFAIAPSPAFTVTDGAFSHTSGSIHSTNTVSTNSGGNSGSHVVTGDQSSSITVVNIGPTDSNDSAITSPPAPQPASAPQCTDRMCLRTR